MGKECQRDPRRRRWKLQLPTERGEGRTLGSAFESRFQLSLGAVFLWGGGRLSSMPGSKENPILLNPLNSGSAIPLVWKSVPVPTTVPHSVQALGSISLQCSPSRSLIQAGLYPSYC